ncbi:hypothetical protein [Pseudonocardia parietis]|uniref:Folate-dependent phosphoribosylglycinamide formyltransferase PurN n=1 Tax=Pseudonocardia parietis TaxID=570936 RepID=A0ABS4W2D8_9PSEU|nr:hypothetical protein [Pseudonocardia parietis]MBP2370278.1 folate-dependent phosphoribosylglycinamide formyltransferase PurN [Pseudonocardia parietis]
MTRISSYCHRNGCVAVTAVNTGVWIHPSALPWWRGLHFTDAEYIAFEAGMRAGEFTLAALRADTDGGSDA